MKKTLDRMGSVSVRQLAFGLAVFGLAVFGLAALGLAALSNCVR